VPTILASSTQLKAGLTNVLYGKQFNGLGQNNASSVASGKYNLNVVTSGIASNTVVVTIP
jgi:hypothetical protein